MKKTIIVTAIVCCSIFAAYVAGQSQTKEKHIEPCCCKHTQQIAEDLHWIRNQMSKPYIPRDIPIFEDPGNPPDVPPPKIPEFNIKVDDGKINFPKSPKKSR
jgi:hypothetical protein